MAQSNGRIILLNGTSSAGKSTLARELRVQLEPQFHYYSSDQLADAGFRPLDEDVRFKYRDTFFEGFHKSIPAFATVGLDLLVEHIVECQRWADDLKVLLSPFDVFWVGVHAPVAEIERRERLRGDRQIGEGVYHLKTHTFCKYDLEIDTMQPLKQNVETILAAWRNRSIFPTDVKPIVQPTPHDRNSR
jgi:chloramphenicol 3-O phosphotransferase